MDDRQVVSRSAIRLVVLVAGISTMGTEMCASRLLAPFFGSSVMVWANIIGLILIYLSVGYWLGGRTADKYPFTSSLGRIILIAGATIATLPFVAAPVLKLAVSGLASSSAGALIGSFIGSLLLFAVPITLLGMVPPYAIRLAINDVEHSGAVAGNLYALSTIGSIIGTFGSVLFLIPFAGTRRTLLAFALALVVLSAVCLRGRSRVWSLMVALLVAIAMALPTGVVKASAEGKVLFEKDSAYQYVQVVKRPDGRRLLHLNEGWSVHSIWDPDTVLTENIWDHFVVLPLAVSKDNPKDFLIVGNAAGTAARAYRKVHPDIKIDGVEIDGVVTDAGRDLFQMPSDNIKVHTADGRPFLQRSGSRQWDIILVDAYRQPYIPFYLTTQEFFLLTSKHLDDQGVVAINVGSAPNDDRILNAISRTMREVYPVLCMYPAETYNDILIASKNPGMSCSAMAAGIKARISESMQGIDTKAQPRGDKGSSDRGLELDLRTIMETFAAELVEAPRKGGIVLTDDRAPVEWMTDQMIIDFVRKGEM